MHPQTENKLIEVLEDIANELNSINTNTSNINIELEQLNSQEFYSSNSDYTIDIAKNIADIGLEINHQLKGIGYCLDDNEDHGFFEKRKEAKK